MSTCGLQESVKLWDVGTRQELLTLSSISVMLETARWGADGNAILAGTPWQVWRAPSWDEITAAEAEDPPSSDLGGQGKAESKQP